MANKLWEKTAKLDAGVESYTVGLDREMDLYLAPFDVLGSMAHIRMLNSIGLLADDELAKLTAALRDIYREATAGNFVIEEGIEDVHSQVELMLTRRLGDIGKKIHSGRSRNDQVLVDLKLFIRSAIEEVTEAVGRLFDTLLTTSQQYKDVIIPGYTHLQVAMPSSVGLWLGAYAESLVDDMSVLRAAYEITNRNPLGSAAGYGSSFPLNRSMTTDLLGFESMDYNVVYAQMGRGKTERIVAQAIASIAATVGKLAYDACLYNSQNFGFIKLPDEFTTGSSIMPHKKNPDVFELTRAKCNKLQALPVEITMITNNLPSGYFRDLQLVKESFLPSFDTIISILDMVSRMIAGMKVNDGVSRDQRYAYMYSVEEVNRLVVDGVPFRDAYKRVGLEIERGEFTPDYNISHTHEGSIGNLCNDRIRARFDNVLAQFNFADYHAAFSRLIND
jgi:argininosuccinate lyase